MSDKDWKSRFEKYLDKMMRSYVHEAAWYEEQATLLVNEIENHTYKRDGDAVFHKLEWLAAIIVKSLNIVWPRGNKKDSLAIVRAYAMQTLCDFPKAENDFQKGIRSFRNKLMHFEEKLGQDLYRTIVILGQSMTEEESKFYNFDYLLPAGRFSVNEDRAEMHIELKTLKCFVLGESFDLRRCGAEPGRIYKQMERAYENRNIRRSEWDEKFGKIVQFAEESGLKL